MANELEALSPLALSALEAERSALDVDAALEARVLAKVAATVAFGASGAVAVGAASSATAASATAGASSAAATALGLGKVVPLVALAFVGGAGAGAVVHAVATRPVAPPVVVVPPPKPVTPVELAPTPTPVIAPSPAPVPSPPPVLKPTPKPAPAPVVVPMPPSDTPDVQLTAERALIDRARSALLRRDGAAALSALDAHAAAHPDGRLAEEREALVVQALAAAGRLAAAQERAARFAAKYPSSVLLPAVQAAVAPK